MKKALIKIGFDALAIVAIGFGAMLLPEFVPALRDLEVFIAVCGGIWLYIPLRNFIEKKRK